MVGWYQRTWEERKMNKKVKWHLYKIIQWWIALSAIKYGQNWEESKEKDQKKEQ